MYYKNRPDYFESFDLNVVENQDEYKISIDELEFPKKLIVNSIIPTDRFIYKDSKPDEFYQYLGARSTSSTSSTKSAVKKTIKHIFNATYSGEEFKLSLKASFDFFRV